MQKRNEYTAMSRMGQDLLEAVQEALDHSEGKIDLSTLHMKVVPVHDTISVEKNKNAQENPSLPGKTRNHKQVEDRAR